MNVGAGIVSYNPIKDILLKNLEILLNQVNKVVIVDNNSSNSEEIENLITNFGEKVRLIRLSENKGIASALNIIVHYFQQLNYEWVLLLDQDSIVPKNMIENFLKYTNVKDLGIICPSIVDRNYLKSSIKENKFEFVNFCITSGSFINVNAFKKIGDFDENMFIDYVDFEYCIRLRKSGYKILKVGEVKLIHRLGRLRVYKFFNKRIYITNHPPFRYYYYVRNLIYTHFKHRSEISFAYVISTIFKRLIKITFFEKQKLKKIKAIFKGVIDGLFLSKSLKCK